MWTLNAVDLECARRLQIEGAAPPSRCLLRLGLRRSISTGFGFRVSQVSGVSAFGFRDSGFGIPVSGFELRDSGFGFRVFEFRVSGSGRCTQHMTATRPARL